MNLIALVGGLAAGTLGLLLWLGVVDQVCRAFVQESHRLGSTEYNSVPGAPPPRDAPRQETGPQ